VDCTYAYLRTAADQQLRWVATTGATLTFRPCTSTPTSNGLPACRPTAKVSGHWSIDVYLNNKWLSLFVAPGTAVAPPTGTKAVSGWRFYGSHNSTLVSITTISVEWASKGDCCTANGGCFFAQAYADNMAYIGEEYVDRVGVGGLFAESVMIGGIEAESRQGTANSRSTPRFRSDGIFGVASGSNCNPTCKPTVIAALCKANKLPSTYSLCLQGFKGGISSVDIGGINRHKCASPLLYLSMLTTASTQTKPPDTMTIGSPGGKTMSIQLSNFNCKPATGSLFDSGTSNLQIPAAAFAQFVPALLSHSTSHSAEAGLLVQWLCGNYAKNPKGGCGEITPLYLNVNGTAYYDARDVDLNDAFPTLYFTWSEGGRSFTGSVKPTEYIYINDDLPYKTLSFGIVPQDEGVCFTFGDVMMQNLYTSFDRGNNRVGISNSTSCASDGDREACSGLKTVQECQSAGIGCVGPATADAAIECNQAHFSQVVLAPAPAPAPVSGFTNAAWISHSAVVDGMSEGTLYSSYQNMKYTTPEAVGQVLLSLATTCATQCLSANCGALSVFATEPLAFGTTKFTVLACITLNRMPSTLSTRFTWNSKSIKEAVIVETIALPQQVQATHLLGTTVNIMMALNYEIKPGSLRRVAPPRCEWKTDIGCKVLMPKY